eukprot:3728337-Amphidinium_carterae.1
MQLGGQVWQVHELLTELDYGGWLRASLLHTEACLAGTERKSTGSIGALECVPLRPSGDPLPPITGEELRHCARNYAKGKATGQDGLSLRVLRYLPSEFLSRFADILNKWELDAVVPESLGHLIVMLPKTELSRRPIGITCLFFRAWSRVRLKLLLAWTRTCNLPGAWGTSGRRCELAGWLTAARQEFAAAVHCAHATLLLDLHKFYEYVSHSKLREAAAVGGVALRLVELAACCYAGPRAISVEGMFG